VPQSSGTLQESDRGGTFCLHVGEELTAFLRVPIASAADRWRPVEADDPNVLAAVPSGIMTLPRGVTAAIFRGLKPGLARISSTRPPCLGREGCPPDQAWEATIEVQP
jgi:hypothetical protein